MYALEVRDHIMVAHTLPGEAFGPAQGLHGATFVVDAAFFAATLSQDDIVVDIGLAADALKRVLAPLNYKNLDTLPAFAARRSTTEALCRHIHEALSAEAAAGRLGRPCGELASLRVTLHESHVARAWYEAALR
jgi:6-pyruvoyl-tetrahydropterin synthase